MAEGQSSHWLSDPSVAHDEADRMLLDTSCGDSGGDVGGPGGSAHVVETYLWYPFSESVPVMSCEDGWRPERSRGIPRVSMIASAVDWVYRQKPPVPPGASASAHREGSSVARWI